MTDVKAILEEIGMCVGCAEPVYVGQAVTPWDDEIGHYNCRDPYSLAAQPELDGDPEIPPALVLLGSPARYIALPKVRALI